MERATGVVPAACTKQRISFGMCRGLAAIIPPSPFDGPTRRSVAFFTATSPWQLLLQDFGHRVADRVGAMLLVPTYLITFVLCCLATHPAQVGETRSDLRTEVYWRSKHVTSGVRLGRQSLDQCYQFVFGERSSRLGIPSSSRSPFVHSLQDFVGGQLLNRFASLRVRRLQIASKLFFLPPAFSVLKKNVCPCHHHLDDHPDSMILNRLRSPLPFHCRLHFPGFIIPSSQPSRHIRVVSP